MYHSSVNARARSEEGNHRQLNTPLQGHDSWSSSNQADSNVNQPLYPSMNAHTIARNDPRNTFMPMNPQFLGEVGHDRLDTSYRCFEPFLIMHHAYGRASTALYPTVHARTIVINYPSTTFVRPNSLHSVTDSDEKYSNPSPKHAWARSPIIRIHENNIWDPEIPLNTPWNRRVEATSSGPFLYNNTPNRGSESAAVLPYTHIESLSNTTRREIRPVIACGAPSDHIPNAPANMKQRSPVVNVSPIGSSKKKPEGSNKGHSSQRYHDRNLDHSTTQQPPEHNDGGLESADVLQCTQIESQSNAPRREMRLVLVWGSPSDRTPNALDNMRQKSLVVSVSPVSSFQKKPEGSNKGHSSQKYHGRNLDHSTTQQPSEHECRYLHNGAYDGGLESVDVLLHTQIKSQSNATRPKTRPVMAWGSPSDRISDAPANMGQRSPVVNGSFVGSSKKKPERSNKSRSSQRSHERNLNHSTTEEPPEHECRHLYNSGNDGGLESADVLPYMQIKSQSNATRRKTRPVMAWGSPSDRTSSTPASMTQRSPVANAAPVHSTKKKPESPKRGRCSQRSLNRNSNHSTTQQPLEHECDLLRSLFVKKLPKIRELEKQLRSLFKRAGFKPTKITRPTQVDRFRDFAFIEFRNTEIANEAMVKMDGAEFGGNNIKVEKADRKKLSRNGNVPQRTRFDRRQTR